MRKHLFYLSMVLVLTLFSACGGGKKGVFTPTSSGRAYEVLVVVEPGLWERPAGRALFDVLDSDVPGLPQSERSFRIMYTSITCKLNLTAFVSVLAVLFKRKEQIRRL